jgi:hypothetical protein
MAKTVCTLVGVVFILVGIAGFVKGDLLGAHLSMAHNVVHLASGALALYLGTKGTLAAAKTFALVFGLVYLALGVVGFFAGHPGSPHADIPGPSPDDRLLSLLPGTLELGQMDHIIHIAIGALFLIAALATKTSMKRAVD